MNFYIKRQEWDQHNPRPVHPEHGPALCPDLILFRIERPVAQCCPDGCARCAAVHVQMATIPAWATWEPETSEQNEAGLREAERVVAALEAGWNSQQLSN